MPEPAEILSPIVSARDVDPALVPSGEVVSVVIPARNEELRIETVVRSVRSQDAGGRRVEVVVVDDGSSDGTGEVARRAGARVIRISRAEHPTGRGGNPAAARNRGVAAAAGDPVVFLDADCLPSPGWLQTLLDAHAGGAAIVGGSLELPAGSGLWARCDYYNAWYHTHPRRARGVVPNHPPANLSVRRAVLGAGPGFEERGPVADGHEELAWQAWARARGREIVFEPRAMAYHQHDPRLRSFLARSYRWGYSTLQAKATSPTVRLAGVYRHPWLALVTSLVLTPVHGLYVVACWVSAGRLEPLLLFPGIFLGRLVYAAGLARGGLRWLLGERRAEGRGPGGARTVSA
jgi:hypothetical protein